LGPKRNDQKTVNGCFVYLSKEHLTKIGIVPANHPPLSLDGALARIRHFGKVQISRRANVRRPIMAAAGHHSLEMHNRYVNVNENHQKDAFKVFPTCSQENPAERENS
jgi:hypothetical protein